jgi:hypothetical protein
VRYYESISVLPEPPRGVFSCRRHNGKEVIEFVRLRLMHQTRADGLDTP